MRLPVNTFLPLAAFVLLPGCLPAGTSSVEALPPASVNGPRSDFPVVVGEPFTIDGVTYTPIDTLNYDAVGYATQSANEQAKIAGAHKILPLPSYVEVTHLNSGKTILVRLEERGPMTNDSLIELTRGAAKQLGIIQGENAAVRVRRVNPPEAERALLRSGSSVSPRMDTPEPLLKVLKRKLAEEKPLPPAKPLAPVKPPPAAAKPMTTIDPDKVALPSPSPRPAPAAKPSPALEAPSESADAAGAFVVQAAAFSSKERADKAAAKLGAAVTKPGKYWLMQLGPFRTQNEAKAALEKAKTAGYSDARIQRANP